MTNCFCFIICTNNELWFQECANYIRQLRIPDGYDISVLAIKEAASMTSGYNEGMNSSDAKYKIYLHQDTFIINQNFLFDILTLFKDPSIGLIGVVGSPKLATDGIMWHAKRVGALYQQQPFCDSVPDEPTQTIPYTEVDCVDGLVLITQYDIPWRSDLFTGWDFYDISQCFEFRKKNLKVIVPEQLNPWILHDCGNTLLWTYEKYWKIFLQEYSDMLQN